MSKFKKPDANKGIMITEREFYDYCNMYCNELRLSQGDALEEGEQRTFYFLALYETDERVGMLSGTVDPSLPDTQFTKEQFLQLPMRHQVIVKAHNKLKEVVTKTVNQVIKIEGAINQLKRVNLDVSDVVKAVMDSDGPEEFEQNLRALITERDS